MTADSNGNVQIADGTTNFDVASHDGTNGLKLGGTLVTASAAELNKLAGTTATTAQLNALSGNALSSIAALSFGGKAGYYLKVLTQAASLAMFLGPC